uniref:Cilia- and flagella-associated protein 45 n=1 Tax=Cacopsylla melanoneura TaxID=428564 RepID=A0A8D8RI61_9HEMI
MRSSKSFTNLFQLEPYHEQPALQISTPAAPKTGNPNKRRYVQLVTNTGVRRLLIPESRVTVSSAGVVDWEVMNRIKHDVKQYINPEPKYEKALRVLEEKEHQALASDQRKQELARCARRCKTAGTGREKIQAMEDFQRDNLLISRAIELQREREDEMKLCNSLLLMSKCQTIRDAQVAEKTLIAKELRAVELDLDRIMEEDRVKAIAVQDKLREEEEMKKRHQFESLTKQMTLNKQLRDMAVCAVEQERQRMRQIEERRKQELENERKEKLIEQERRKKEIDETNQELKRIKEEEKEQEVMLNSKIQNILKVKLAAEERQANEKRQIQLLRDKEFARLEKERKRNDVTAQAQYEIKCRKVQEECDREWRRRELEEVRRRNKMASELNQCRRQQEEHKQLCQARELERMRELENTLEQQRREAEEKEKEKEIRRKQKMLNYRRNLQKLMEDKRSQKQKQNEDNLEDGRKMREEQKNRIEGLKTSIERKIVEVRNQKVPEKYLKEVEKQLQKQLMKIKI